MHRIFREFGLLMVASVVFGCGLYFWLRTSTPRRHSLKMTAGDATGLRHKLALELADQVRTSGIDIQVEETRGSEYALAAVAKGDFDLAMVQGGLSVDPQAPIRQVSALHVEPLHLLVSQSIYQQVEQNGMAGLAGRHVNLGPVGSGTHNLAQMVLEMAGLSEDGSSGKPSYDANLMAYTDLMSAEPSKLPDAVFTVSSLPAPIADYLVDKHNYRLIPLKFGEAIALSAFAELSDTHTPGAIDKRYIHVATIPPFTYSISHSEPPTALETLGTRVLLIANAKVEAQVVDQLLDALFQSSFAKATRPPLNASLLDLPAEYPLHPGSIHYRIRNKPLIAGDAIDLTEKVLAISATLVGGLFFVVQWYVRSRKRRREANFANYMERVIRIESTVLENEVAAELDLAELIRLQKELGDLKSQAVRRFAAGELEGEGLINGFLALVNDARNQLTRLILHQRENIEELAQQKHIDQSKVWMQQAAPDREK